MNMLEEHALLERPSGNPECLDRIITLQPTDQPSSHQSPIHHTMCQHITRGYTVPFMDVDFTVLAIDPGTSQMGWALIQWKGYKPQIRRAGTVKGAGIPLKCHEAAQRLVRACHPHAIDVVLLEVPAARYYPGRNNSAELCYLSQQICFLTQGFLSAYHLASYSPFIDYVDSYEWQQFTPAGKRSTQLNDKQKAAVFAHVFGHWQQQTNSHERDAALMGHWWGSVLLKNRKPMWCFGISEAQVKP